MYVPLPVLLDPYVPLVPLYRDIGGPYRVNEGNLEKELKETLRLWLGIQKEPQSAIGVVFHNSLFLLYMVS
jgi:hypothetical protein